MTDSMLATGMAPGSSYEKVVKMASLNPVKLLGIDKSKGSLSDGKDADFIVLDDNLVVQATFIKGKNVFKKSY